MKITNKILKIAAALAAIAGVVYVIATYGDKIVAWAKRLLGIECNCECDCECDCDDCENCECTCENCECDCDLIEEVEEAAPAEETAAAEETDFQN